MSHSRCYQCFRPLDLCYCRELPRIANQTDVLLLQHRVESRHPFNTARMVATALQRCQLVQGYAASLGASELPLRGRPALLYPGPQATNLCELPASERPTQLVVIDGTWHHAKTMHRDIPGLAKLPKVTLPVEAPGQYRIRREPTAAALSTVEATVGALRILEPETSGLRQLMRAFTSMIEQQLTRSQANVRRRMRQPPGKRHLPRRLLADAGKLVVVYAESMPREKGLTQPLLPYSWHACRLSNPGATFEVILSDQQPPDAILSVAELTESSLPRLSNSQFADQWANYLGEQDALVVFHSRTAKLAERLGASLPPTYTLKSICRRRGYVFRDLEDLLTQWNALPARTSPRGRFRLEGACAVAEYLRRSVSGGDHFPASTGSE